MMPGPALARRNEVSQLKGLDSGVALRQRVLYTVANEKDCLAEMKGHFQTLCVSDRSSFTQCGMACGVAKPSACLVRKDDG